MIADEVHANEQAATSHIANEKVLRCQLPKCRLQEVSDLCMDLCVRQKQVTKRCVQFYMTKDTSTGKKAKREFNTRMYTSLTQEPIPLSLSLARTPYLFR